MSGAVMKVIEGTFTAVILFIIVSQAYGFSQVVSAISGAYNSAVRTLQGI